MSEVDPAARHAVVGEVPPGEAIPNPDQPVEDDVPRVATMRSSDDRHRHPDDGRGDHQLPRSEAAEQAVLGAMLLDQDAALKAAGLLDHTMFYREGHRQLFRAMTALTERGDVVDPVTLHDALVKRGELDRVGGMEYIGSLIDAVPTAAHMTSHVRIVAETAARREIIRVATRVIAAASNGTALDQLTATAQAVPELLARTLGAGICAQAFSPPLLADFAPGTAAGASWVVPGYAARDVVTLLAGLAKVGKTTFLADLAASTAAGATFVGREVAGGPVLWIDLEQPEGLTKRVLARHCFASALVYVQHGRVPALATVARWCREKGVVLVVLDSLTKIYKMFGVEDENDPVQVERALQPLLDFARAAHVALVILHHLRKSGGDEGLDVRGSGQIAAAVDIVVSMRRFGMDPNSPDSRRTLHAVSRFEETPHQLVVEYLDHRYRACGTVAQVRRQKERDQVMAALTADPQTAEEVARASSLAASAARTVLKELADAQAIRRTGEGVRGNPFQYAK